MNVAFQTETESSCTVRIAVLVTYAATLRVQLLQYQGTMYCRTIQLVHSLWALVRSAEPTIPLTT
jgi:hypothetical protein